MTLFRPYAVAAASLTAVLVAASASPHSPPSAPAPPARVDYNRDVRPILSEYCFVCHGLDTNKRYAGLRLDRADGAYKVLPSDRRAAVVPGNPAASELMARVTTTADGRMPPPEFGKRLTPAQIDVLRRWIAQGAVYAPHWAYVPVRRPAVPAAPAGDVATRRWLWARSPIDRFLLARLDREHLHPSPEADRRTLIRRVTLDLTGLPPTPGEVAVFLADRRPDAYERVVNRLLTSPHYGERMAEYWLDEVRYADTVGYHGDQDVSLWPYRDYVIRSLSADKPFDAFTREQLAGDLLPNATDEQRVASAYNRLGEMTTEGGAQDKEYLAKYAADRVRNLSGTWLGATLQCAECHDHKYDLYSQRDFYRLEAFFADLKEHGFYPGGGDNDWGPSMRLPSPDQKTQVASLDARIVEAKRNLDEVGNDALASGRAAWEQQIRDLDSAHSLGWQPVTPIGAATRNGATLTILPDASVRASGKLPAFETYTVTVPLSAGPVTAVRVDTVPDDALPGNGISRASWYFVLSEVDASVQEAHGVAQPIAIQSVIAGSDDEGYPGYAMIDGRPDTGWATIYGHAGDRRAVFHFAQPVAAGPNARLVLRMHFDAQPRLQLGRFRLLVSRAPAASLDRSALPDDVLAVVRKDQAARSDADKKELDSYYRRVAPELQAKRDLLARLEGERSVLLGHIPQVLVSEATTPRTMRLLPRGNWMDDTGEIVQPGVPHFLQQCAATGAGGRATRLDLANWLVSRDNPLTARVFVNRLWKLFFGIGIAKNLDDFGAQGEMPVHSELLDWLAGEFMSPSTADSYHEDAKARRRHEVLTNGGRRMTDGRPTASDRRHTPNLECAATVTHHASRITSSTSLVARQAAATQHATRNTRPAAWSIKHIIRIIVTSAAYRQASTPTPELLARDPDNRLYARQSPIRLDAEFIHDTALAVSGLLVPTVGGPSVHPYEPRGYLAPLNFPRREWADDAGPDVYRRGLYTHWQRTFLHPALLAFDASSREDFSCTRAVSNTPMQALVLMNEPEFVEAARVFAARIVHHGGATFASRLAFAYNVALCRAPQEREAVILRRLFARERARYAADPAAAAALLHDGDAPAATGDPVELAAWTAVARAILNLHETITRS